MSWLFGEAATPEKTIAPSYESDIFASQVSSAENKQLRDEKDEHVAKNTILAQEKKKLEEEKDAHMAKSDELSGELFARQVSSQEKGEKINEHIATTEELRKKVAELEEERCTRQMHSARRTEEHSAANVELQNKVAELERIKHEMQDTLDSHRGNQRTCAACTVS